MKRVVGAAAGLGALVAWGELSHWWASRQGLGSSTGEPDVVVVLGYPANRDGSPHRLQRWRTELAVQTGPRATLVFTGGARTGERSEAAQMAGLARALGVPDERIVLEEESHTTWENVTNVVPLLEDADRIAIVSNAVHARRARRYLTQQRPDLAARLVPAADYRLFDHWWLKPILAGYELGVRLGFGTGPALRRSSTT